MLTVRRLISQTEISEFLQQKNLWSLKDSGIEKTLEFSKYMDSIEFINKLAIKAEELNHHPDLTVGWCKIHVRFSTHDLGGISTFDLKMAEETNIIFQSFR